MWTPPLLDTPLGGKGRPSSQARRLRAYIASNCLLFSCELLVGVCIGNVHLISDAFHLCFGCGVLVTSYLSLVSAEHCRYRDECREEWSGYTRASATVSVYSYGKERMNVLAAFTNVVFLLFLALNLLVHALRGVVQRADEHSHCLIVSAAANLAINSVGLFVFSGHMRGEHMYRASADVNLHGVALHLRCDSVRSLALLATSLAAVFNVPQWEPVILLGAAGIIAVDVWPLCRYTTFTLLQASPMRLHPIDMRKLLQEIAMLEGVKKCSDVHVWSVAPNMDFGSLKLTTFQGVDETTVLKQARRVAESFLGPVELVIQVEVDDWAQLLRRSSSQASTRVDVHEESGIVGLELLEREMGSEMYTHATHGSKQELPSQSILGEDPARQEFTVDIGCLQVERAMVMPESLPDQGPFVNTPRKHRQRRVAPVRVSEP